MGVGTNLITAYDQPALGAVYKLASIENEAGEMIDTVKISSNAEKVTTPGKKKYIESSIKATKNRKAIISLFMTRIPPQKKELKCFTLFIPMSANS